MDNLVFEYIREAFIMRNLEWYQFISNINHAIKRDRLFRKIAKLGFFDLSLQFFMILNNMYTNMHITQYDDITIYENSFKINIDNSSYLIYYRASHSYKYIVYGKATFEIDNNENIPKRAMKEWKLIKDMLRNRYLHYIKDLSIMGVMF